MSHSNSSLNCFSDCMAKYNHSYVLHTEPCKPPSPHLVFGTMAHEVLYKAGKIRDEYKDGISLEYEPCIPSEVLYPELKIEFQIKSWRSYFLSVIKQVAKYEEDIIKELQEKHAKIIIERELKLQQSPEEIYNKFNVKVKEPFVGIIDLLLIAEDEAVILDYKFSTTQKTQEDFDHNSQLPLYMMFVHEKYNIPYHNIKVGYIDIPKKSFDMPTVLTNGTLSRSKSQNVSADFYEKAVIAIHGDDDVYNCKPGGYYYDCWCNLQLNKAAYLSIQYLDSDCFHNILNDLMKTAEMIDFMKQNNMMFLRKYNSYSCKNCEYVNSCKPWLGVNYD